MSNHTPGPWRVHGDMHIVTDEDRKNVAMVYETRDFSCAPGRSVMDANARLIASAPYLLQACTVALEHVAELQEAWRTGAITEHDGKGGTRSNLNSDVLAWLRKAIEKAEGTNA
jgi:hypothetical protein